MRRVYSFDKTLSDGKIVSVCIPKMPHLRANITYRCDRKCPNCNRACGVAPSNPNEDMKVEQFEKVMNDSVELKKVWTKIILTGGEPTQHPDLMGFADAAMYYCDKINPECNVWLATFHHPKFFHKAEEVLSKHNRIKIMGVPKEKPREHVFAPYLAPVDKKDADPNHFYRGCHNVGSLCGTTVDYKGFWCCPVAPAIARVFNLDIAVPELKQVSIESLTAQYDQSCRRCGYYNFERVCGESEPMSDSWSIALKRYITNNVEIGKND